MSKRDPEDLGLEATQQLRLVRPAVDRVGMEALRVRAEQALFCAAQPAQRGRFVLLDTVASGGMGVVYRAYDPQLDRKVALKVIKPGACDDRQAREWLLAEARLLARLEHPNIVPIHDVTLVDDQVVMVMELVEGDTLDEWQVAAPRTWRQIVDVYVAAGRGLAAAHARGLVHRDFKPANAIVGTDGRVRVIDFGLAQNAGTDEGEGAGTAPPLVASALTTPTPGAVVGTPAYMAPEQMTGGGPSPAADQFSFCVALHQALFGVRPFAGDSIGDLLASIRSRRVVAPLGTGGVPPWLRALVMRGLDPDPSARHPSLDALLDQLDRRPARRRWPLALAVGLVASGAVGLVALDRPAPAAVEPPACSTAALDLHQAWSSARSDLVRTSLVAIGVPSADEVVDRLDAYGQAWIQAQGGACRAHRAGLLSEQGFAQTSRCLRRRKADLATVAGTLQVAPGIELDALAVVSLLDPAASCTDPEVLAAEDALPAGDRARAQVEEVGDLLRNAAFLSVAGRPARAVEVASSALWYAQATGHTPTIVLAALAKGTFLSRTGAWAAAVQPLTLARDLALAQDPPLREAAVEAGARRLIARVALGVELPSLRSEIELIEPVSVGLRDRFARPLLLNAIGGAYSESGDRDRATGYFARAHGEVARGGDAHLELTGVDVNLAIVTADAAARMELLHGVLERRRARLGPAHSYVLGTRKLLAALEPDPVAALPLADQACARYAELAPARIAERVTCAYLRAFIVSEQGDRAAAARYVEVVELARGAADRETQAKGELAAGYAALATGAPDVALPHFQAVLAASAGAGDLDERVRAADAHLGAGLALHALRRPRPAIAHLELAEEVFALAAALDEMVARRQRLALARLGLAAALRARGHAGTRPRDLERQAADYYRATAPIAYRWRLDTLGS